MVRSIESLKVCWKWMNYKTKTINICKKEIFPFLPCMKGLFGKYLSYNPIFFMLFKL